MTVTVPDVLDCIVIGGGVIGIAIGRALALAGRKVVILEAETELAMHTSSRNSEVIHAGIYYPENSLKAKLCVRGRTMLYEYCRDRDVPHKRIGKIIVACDGDDRRLLENYAASAVANGVDDLVRLDGGEIRRLEPAVSCVAGLLSPSTGIVDSHAFISALRADLESADGVILCRSRVNTISPYSGGMKVAIRDNGKPLEVRCRVLVNAAGLWANSLALSAGSGTDLVPPLYLAKAHYFVLQGPPPFGRLIYPVASSGGLGIHVTLDQSGSVRFGPDVSWVDDIDYSFDESRLKSFIPAIRRYYPDLNPVQLVPGYTGIRPKLSAAGQPMADFVIQDERVHGMPGLVNLFGIESPGLTASLAIADTVSKLVVGKSLSSGLVQDIPEVTCA